MSVRFAYLYNVAASLLVVVLGLALTMFAVFWALFIVALFVGDVPSYVPGMVSKTMLFVGDYVIACGVFCIVVIADKIYCWIRLDKSGFAQEVASIPFSQWVLPASGDKVIRRHVKPIRKKADT